MRRVLAVAVLSCLAAAPARADKASGTWSGQVEARGNYYWEQSTRVVAPQVSATIEAPNGLHARGAYLIDAITSASVAAGALVDQRFTETRHDFTLGAGYEFDLGSADLDVELDGHLSSEPDYLSRAGTLSSNLFLFDRATELQVSATYLADDIDSVIRNSDGVGNATDIGTLHSVVLTAGWVQTLSRVAVISVGYDFDYLFGYLANPYRSVSLGAAPLPERHPENRVRHTLYTRFQYYVPATRTAFHALLRGYADSWNIYALTPEARVYQEVGDALMIRLRYRYYTQGKSFFQEDRYLPTQQYRYYTADPKMTAFHTQLLGTQVVVPLAFLENTAFHFAWRATVDFSFEYVWNTNAFGNATIVQGGAQIPF